MKPVLLTLAELLHTCELGPPLDEVKSAAEQDVLAEAHYDHLPFQRFAGEETEGLGLHLFALGDGTDAEEAHLSENVRAPTKMTLARCLQRNDSLAPGESLQSAWNQTLATLQGRTAAWLPLAAPPAAPLAGRARGRGRAGRGRARGRA